MSRISHSIIEELTRLAQDYRRFSGDNLERKRREDIARIIDPKAWEKSDGINDSRVHPVIGAEMCDKLEAPSLAKADLILAYLENVK